MNEQRKNKTKEINRRLDAIKSLMSTFAMSAAAVVATTLLIPASPKAEIIKAEAYSDVITYQVSVTDADEALDLDTLFVVLENQFEYYEQSLSLGENSGFFDDLSGETAYTLSVYGSKGFGQERLDSINLWTYPIIGGAILSVNPQDTQGFTSYIVNYQIYDPNSTYESIYLYYGYVFESGMEMTYDFIEITQDSSFIELTDIYTSESFHIYIEATTLNATEILDEIWVTPRFELYSQMYLNYVTKDSIYLYTFNEAVLSINPSYEVKVYDENHKLVTTKTIIVTGEMVYSEIDIEIHDLSPQTIYHVIGSIKYTNPQTLRSEALILLDIEVTTLDDYQIDTFLIVEYDTYFEVTVLIRDPNHYFQLVYYEIYDVSDIYPQYYESMQYFFYDPLNKTVTFMIDKPLLEDYQLTIGLRNDTIYSIKDVIYDKIYN